MLGKIDPVQLFGPRLERSRIVPRFDIAPTEKPKLPGERSELLCGPLLPAAKIGSISAKRQIATMRYTEESHPRVGSCHGLTMMSGCAVVTSQSAHAVNETLL